MIVDKGEFLLKNYSNTFDVKFIFQNQLVNIEKISYDKGNYSLLTIVAKQNEDQTLQLALDIRNLLSLALGTRIIFDKHSFWSGKNERVVNRTMQNGINAGFQIIPDGEISIFLKSTLSVWFKLSGEEKREFYIVIDFLNKTRKDFVEDRVLKLMQAWECSAVYWSKSNELSDDLLSLQSKIMKVFKDWKKESGFKDENGVLGANLKISMNQESLMSRIEKFIVEKKYKSQQLISQLKDVKKMRDQTVHSGQIKKSGEEVILIMEPVIKALQLIILYNLGYQGLIIDTIDNWVAWKDISEYFD